MAAVLRHVRGPDIFSATFGRDPEGKKWDQHLKFERTWDELIVRVDGVALAPETSGTNHLNTINLLSGTAYIIGQNNNPPIGGTSFGWTQLPYLGPLRVHHVQTTLTVLKGFAMPPLAMITLGTPACTSINLPQTPLRVSPLTEAICLMATLPIRWMGISAGPTFAWQIQKKPMGTTMTIASQHGSNEGVEAALNLNEPGDLALDQSPSHFSIEIAEAPFSDAGEMTLGFWIEINQAATEGQNHQVVSVNGDEAGGFAIDYKKLPTGQVEFFQLILNDGPSMLTYLSHTTSPQGPIHGPWPWTGSWSVAGARWQMALFTFGLTEKKVSTPGSTNNLWGSWVENETTWTHLIFGESEASNVAPNFKLDNIRILNGALHLIHLGSCKTSRMIWIGNIKSAVTCPRMKATHAALPIGRHLPQPRGLYVHRGGSRRIKPGHL